MTLRILITGSRDWPDPSVVWEAIEQTISETRATDVMVVHGKARGADDFASRFVTMFKARLASCGIRIDEEPHPAEWEAPCRITCKPGHRKYRNGTTYCPAAGNYRNIEMVEAGADVCLAFIHNESRGASMCATVAELAGIPVRRLT